MNQVDGVFAAMFEIIIKAVSFYLEALAWIFTRIGRLVVRPFRQPTVDLRSYAAPPQRDVVKEMRATYFKLPPYEPLKYTMLMNGKPMGGFIDGESVELEFDLSDGKSKALQTILDWRNER